MRRELDEELGAEAVIGPLLLSEPAEPGFDSDQHVWLARLVSMDAARRHGPELVDPKVAAGYEVVRLLPGDDQLELLVPDALRTLVRTQGEASAALAARL